MDYKFKRGDVVFVRPDLSLKGIYYMRSGPEANDSANFVTNFMLKFAGKEVHIRRICGHQYEINEDEGRHDWTDEMFEDINCIFHGLI